MPYVDQVTRDKLRDDPPYTAGELNYCVTKLCLSFLPDNPKYADYNTVVGVLESAKLEFYRRAVAKYEDQKAFDNGDVYAS